MADSWQQIDNDGVMMDWTSADTIAMVDTYHILEPIKRALNERCIASNASSPILNDTVLCDIYWLCNQIDIKLNALIPMFVNHTNNGGSWVGLYYDYSGTYPIKRWDMSSICTATSTTWQIATRLQPLANWAISRYKILNMLKWVGTRNGFVGYPYYANGQVKTDGGGWVDDTITNRAGIIKKDYTTPNKHIYQYKVQHGISGYNIPYLELYPYCNLEVYLLAGSAWAFDTTYHPTWQWCTMYSAGDHYGLMGTDTFRSGTHTYTGFLHETYMTIDDNGQLRDGQTTTQIGLEAIDFILKFDVANGFKFKDW